MFLKKCLLDIYVGRKKERSKFFSGRNNIHLKLFLFLIAVKWSIEQQREMDNEPWAANSSSSRDEPGISYI
jgi:hypothetical protein